MIYLLPGMGATSAMYQGPWRNLPDVVPLDWPGYRGERTLFDVARRLVDEHAIGAADVVVGSSLGGMVALEIHGLVGPRRVLLVGSALRRGEIRRLLLALSPMAAVAPLRCARRLAHAMPNEVCSMFARADVEFVRAMCRAVARWPGYEGPPHPVDRIHGARDLIIPCPPGVETIPGGGHLIAMTHAQLCVDWVAQATGELA